MSEIAAAAAESGGAFRGHRTRPSLLIAVSFCVVGAVIVMAVVGSLIAPQDPAIQNFSAVLAKPSGAHLLGTDSLGRDVFSRLIAGARTAVLGPFVVATVGMVLGSVLGLLAGYRGGRVDWLISLWVDLMVAVPGLLVLIVVIGALGGGYWVAILTLAILVTPSESRVVRGVTLEQAPRPYVEAAKALGVSDPRIMFMHILPNVAATIVAQMFLTFAAVLVGLSGLSFLGIGLPPGTPNWGLMLAEGRTLLFANPVAALAPGAAIVMTATATNLVGDWLFEHLSSRGEAR